MTIRDVDNAVRNDGKQPIFIVSRYGGEACIRLNNLLRSYETFMQMPVYGLCAGVMGEDDNCTDESDNCIFVTVDAPESVFKAWEWEGRV